MDLYSPAEENEILLPLVIVINGGCFLGSSNRRDDVVAWCDSLAKRGYIAAAINYRKGFNPVYGAGQIGPGKGMLRAAYRGTQDIRTAIRFFKHNYETYHVDTNQICLIGSSSGGIIALHAAFMEKTDGIPAARQSGTGDNNKDLGGIDCGSDLSDEYKKHSTDVHAVISLWGGIYDLSFIEKRDSVDILLIHGTSDNIIPFNSASVFSFGTKNTFLPQIHGSNSIDRYLTRNKIRHECIFFNHAHHVLHSDGRIVLRKLNRAVFPGSNWKYIYEKGIEFLEKNRYKPVLAVEKDSTLNTDG